MHKVSSPYYPPRARWYSGLLNAGSHLRRGLALDYVHLPPGVSLGDLVAGCLVPGWAFQKRAPLLWGRAALLCSVLLLAAFFVWLGRPAGNVTFGLLLSLHSTGLVFLIEPWLVGERLRVRIAASCAAMILLTLLLYAPARSLMESSWLLPLQANGRVVIVRRLASAGGVQRGDWIAYSLSEGSGQNIVTLNGYGLGPVLALAGDRVRFSRGGCEVNGVAQPRLAHMPATGEVVVPQKHWFIWPDFDIRGGHGFVPETELSATMLQLATISEEQFLGKPFKRWFGRRNAPERSAP